MADDIPAAPERVTTEEELRAATIGALQPHNGTVLIVDYDPDWPRQFAVEAAKMRAALGERALLLEHVGSTSTPGLAAKPILDILLVVADSADEPTYVPDLERAGYVLRTREP
ncbi:MAG TPA: GrpB family protein, partial [Ktedonobacterales bacterium]|nr:GrpB family protein [Ktedonobacterales bacterium]